MTFSICSGIFIQDSELLEMKIDVSISNFYDDFTHIKALSSDDLKQLVTKPGFEIVESGIIEKKCLENQLFAFGTTHNDQEIKTYAMWSKFRWAHYIVVEKSRQNWL